MSGSVLPASSTTTGAARSLSTIHRNPARRIAGIDSAEWTACGIEIFGGGGGLVASVLAVRRSLVRTAADWERVARENGGAVPVTRFGLPDGTALGLLGMFKRSVVRAVPREVIAEAGIELEIVDTIDHRQEDTD